MDDAEARATLRDAIAARHAVQARIAALNAGAEKAHRKRMQALDQIDLALSELNAARQRRPADAITAFLNDQTLNDGIAESQARLTDAERQADELRNIQDSLSREIELTGPHLVMATQRVHRALTPLLAPTAATIEAEWTSLWARARTLRALGGLLVSATGTHLPQGRWHTDETLEIGRSGHVSGQDGLVPFAHDETTLSAWRTALERLMDEADVVIPDTKVEA